jgi:hypothetical protein
MVLRSRGSMRRESMRDFGCNHFMHAATGLSFVGLECKSIPLPSVHLTAFWPWQMGRQVLGHLLHNAQWISCGLGHLLATRCRVLVIPRCLPLQPRRSIFFMYAYLNQGTIRPVVSASSVDFLSGPSMLTICSGIYVDGVHAWTWMIVCAHT